MTDTLELDEPKRKAKATKAIIALSEKHGGKISPEIVLADAKRKSSPLHGFFCWDNTRAAEQYRLIQASCLIRRVKVTFHETETKSVRVRAFVSVVDQDAVEEAGDDIDGDGINAVLPRIYIPVQTACAVDSYREQMIRNCQRDVEAFRRKYVALSEAKRIISAMDQFDAEFSLS